MGGCDERQDRQWCSLEVLDNRRCRADLECLGVINFFGQMNADALGTMSEVQRAIIEGRPAWAIGAFAIAVIGGALGCLLLLLRKAAAYYLFIASLLGVIVQMTPYIGMAGSSFESYMYILMPLVVAAFLIWYSKQALNKGWIS